MIRKLREIKPKRRHRRYVTVRRLAKKGKHRLKNPYTTKLGKQLKANRIGNSPRLHELDIRANIRNGEVITDEYN